MKPFLFVFIFRCIFRPLVVNISLSSPSSSYPLLLPVNNGRCILAGKVIVRAWTNFKFAKRLQYLLDEHRVIIYR